MTSPETNQRYSALIDVMLQAYTDECDWTIDNFELNLRSAIEDTDHAEPAIWASLLRSQELSGDANFLGLHAYVMVMEDEPLSKLKQLENYAKLLGENLHSKCSNPAVHITTKIKITGWDYAFIDVDRARENSLKRGGHPKY